MQQQVTPDQAVQIAIQHHQAGRLPDAEAIYRQVLGIQPNRFDALHLLGVLAYQVGKTEAAIDLIRRAISLNPDFAEAHYNLGNALLAERKSQQARAAYARAIELKPDYAEAHNNLGNSLHEQGKLEEAAAAYARALQLSPSFIDAHFNLANANKNRGKFDEAIAGYVAAIQLKPDYVEAYNNLADTLRASGKLTDAQAVCVKAIELRPNYAEGFNNLGNILHEQGKGSEAFAAWNKAIELKPDFAEAHFNIANALRDGGKQDEAIAAYGRSIALKPGFAEAHYHLGYTLSAQDKLDEAVAAYSTAIALAPDQAEANNNLGVMLKEQGLIAEAMAAHDRAIALKPDNAGFGSNRLYAMHFHPDYDAAALGQAHRQWSQRHAEPLKKLAHSHVRPTGAGAGEKRLRIGYVSPNLNMHSVGRFLLPLLTHHDKSQFEIVCYSDVRAADVITGHFESHADQWRVIANQSDEQVAQLVRDDGIDILVDLAKHTGKNRLLAFARKPAPIQVTYLPYCSTTGLDTIDYRLTDSVIDPADAAQAGPPGSAGASYSEKSIRLADSLYCYEPLMRLEVVPQPALSSGHITFGCLNHFAKVSTPALALWGRILRQSAGSRLLLHAVEGSPRQRVLDALEGEGVEPERVTFVSRVSGQDYFELYQLIDIALDPFPCPGGITTCDALWMGVPVVTLSGKTAVGRTGASILTSVGLGGLVARSGDHYVRKAVELGKDPARLATLRGGLRKKLLKSPLMDAPKFVANIEAAYRQMWKAWCG